MPILEPTQTPATALLPDTWISAYSVIFTIVATTEKGKEVSMSYPSK